MKPRDTTFELMPPRRDSRNAIESKHAEIRTDFLRLKKNNDTVGISTQACAITEVSIYNYLYGSSVMSSFEVVKVYFNPIGNHPVQAPDDIVSLSKYTG